MFATTMLNMLKSTYKVELEVIEGMHLKSGDLLITSDPFCKIFSRQAQQQTRHIKNTRFPKWNEKFDMDLVFGEELRFEVWDYDRFTRNDYLGKTTFKFIGGTKGEEIERWLGLDTKGEIKIKITIKDVPTQNSHQVQPTMTMGAAVSSVPVYSTPMGQPYGYYPAGYQTPMMYNQSYVSQQIPSYNSMQNALYGAQVGYSHQPMMAQQNMMMVPNQQMMMQNVMISQPIPQQQQVMVIGQNPNHQQPVMVIEQNPNQQQQSMMATQQISQQQNMMSNQQVQSPLLSLTKTIQPSSNPVVMNNQQPKPNPEPLYPNIPQPSVYVPPQNFNNNESEPFDLPPPQ